MIGRPCVVVSVWLCMQGLALGGASPVEASSIYHDGRTDPHESPREVEEIFMAPWQAAFMEAKALGVMSSYNDYDGIPITGSFHFLTEKLRGEYGFKGYVVSDSDAVEYLFKKHHVAPDYKDAVRQAVEAGLNVRTTFTLMVGSSSEDIRLTGTLEMVKIQPVAYEETDHYRVYRDFMANPRGYPTGAK